MALHLLLPDEPAPVPITNLFSGDEEVAEWEDATTFVAGPLADGTWLAGQTSDYRVTKLQ